jgi:hypothetical protein
VGVGVGVGGRSTGFVCSEPDTGVRLCMRTMANLMTREFERLRNDVLDVSNQQDYLSIVEDVDITPYTAKLRTTTARSNRSHH